MHNAYNKLIPFNMKYQKNTYHFFNSLQALIYFACLYRIFNEAGNFLMGEISFFSHFSMMNIHPGNHSGNHTGKVKAVKYQPHSQHDYHGETDSQHEYIHNETNTMPKTGCNHNKSQQNPQNKKSFSS